jgi:hypothetical protein
MEHAPGKILADVWRYMDVESKIGTVEDIVAVQHKLLSLKFSKSVYFGLFEYNV